MNNTWKFVDGDIVLSSDDNDQMLQAGQWIINLTEAIKAQALQEIALAYEEANNGRTIISDNESSTTEQLELPEVPC